MRFTREEEEKPRKAEKPARRFDLRFDLGGLVSWIGQIVVHFLGWGRAKWNLSIGMERMDEHGNAEDFESQEGAWRY